MANYTEVLLKSRKFDLDERMNGRLDRFSDIVAQSGGGYEEREILCLRAPHKGDSDNVPCGKVTYIYSSSAQKKKYRGTKRLAY